MADPHVVTIEEHRHAEIVEALARINLALEAIFAQGERRLMASASLEAKVESALQYFVRTWQAGREARP